MTPRADLLARIPSMTALLKAAASADAFRAQPHAVTAVVLREAVASIRDRARQGHAADGDCAIDAILADAADRLTTRRAERLTRVINATGVVLHTGLGRSVLPVAAVERISQVAAGYCSLEIDLTTGRRGRRGGYAERLLCELTGAEAALIVNNNAAATMLALRSLARDREVIVSRGQLIEIGGSFRLPEVMIAGGATLREVGTTNKTHLRDYESAIGQRTAMIMHVHTSNYRVVGFSESPSTAELAELAHAHGLLMFDDLGSGALLDDELWAHADEPSVTASLGRGADLVSFSGDKLLGGPQAGILLGKRGVIDGLRGDPMARALRIDKLTIAALEALLELYLEPATARQWIPLLSRLTERQEALTRRAGSLAEKLRAALPRENFEVRQDESFAGGGSLPDRPFPTTVIRWQPTGGPPIDELMLRLRLGDPSVLARVKTDAILLDLRTIAAPEYDELVQAIVDSREATKTS